MSLFIAVLLLLICTALCATKEFDLLVEMGSKQIDRANMNSSVITVNGEFPAPTLVVTVGDDVVVHVRNRLSQPTVVHFHGLLQIGTNFMDGVPYGTQCPIMPNSSFTYRFKADSVGTFWYHAHVDVHFVAGFYGAFIVRQTQQETVPLEEKIIILSDWYHMTPEAILTTLALPPFTTPIPQSILINGRGMFGDSTVPNMIDVQAGKLYRFRIINAAAISLYRFRIDQHNLTVIEADSDETMPFETPYIDIEAGQRYSVLVNMSVIGGTMFNIQVEMMHRTGPSGMAMLMYNSASSIQTTISSSTTTMQTTTTSMSKKRQHEGHGTTTIVVGATMGHGGHDSDNSMPFEMMLMSMNRVNLPAVTHRLNITVQRVNGEWRLNNLAMMNHGKPVTPLLHRILAASGKTVVDTSNPMIALKKGEVVEITWRNLRDESGVNEHHPMHIHGHRFWLLGSSTSGEPQYNAVDMTMPLLRDTFHLSHNDGWAITRFVADNPGLWLVHCHYAWHVSHGMAFYFIYEPTNLLPSLPTDTPMCTVLSQPETTHSGVDRLSIATIVIVVLFLIIVI